LKFVKDITTLTPISEKLSYNVSKIL